MDLRQMEYVVTLADEQQFTRAASICGISQSGLSAAIRNLEDELGTTLFDRTTRRVEPTEAGRVFLPHARTLLAQAAAARDAVEDTSRELTGSLRIGAEQCLGAIDVNALLDRAHRRYPLLELHFAQAGSHKLATQVRDGAIDIAFIAVTEHLGAIERTELGRSSLVLLAPVGHPLAAAERLDWADLRGQDFVDFQGSWAIRSLNDSACAAHGVTRHVRCTVNDVHTLLDLVHRGLGVAIIPQHLAMKPQATGLAVLAMPDDAPSWIVSAITASAASASGHVIARLRAEGLLLHPAIISA